MPKIFKQIKNVWSRECSCLGNGQELLSASLVAAHAVCQDSRKNTSIYSYIDFEFFCLKCLLMQVAINDRGSLKGRFPFSYFVLTNSTEGDCCFWISPFHINIPFS